MADTVDYTCPFCGRPTTLVSERISQSHHLFQIANAAGSRILVSRFRVCPNPACKKFSLDIELWTTYNTQGGGLTAGQRVQAWRLIPPSDALVFPSYVPQAIRDDYEEACLIKQSSPKASATLARRCLQGMIRDFWGIQRQNLFQEIAALETLIDPLTWKAIDAVRKIGNIGAHMEKDVNVIIDVEPDEAAQLIWLIELLVREWYIYHAEREQRLKDVAALAQQKADAKQDAAVAGPKQS